MYRLVRSHGMSLTLSREVPAAAVALVVAELFYKFHSFTLECMAFLATWYVLSAVASFIEACVQGTEEGKGHGRA